jgi:Ser/Thr protein kinase RdoA (MazF antagonist)
MSAPEVIPVLRSLPTAEGSMEVVRRCYDLDVTECVLVRSFVNEVYEVRTPHERYVLKLYHHGGWSAEEVAWEGELVSHLAGNGVPVAKVVRLIAGSQVGEVAAPEGPRPFMLSEYVEGRKPQKPFDTALYYEYGGLVARMHDAGDSFRTVRYRRPLGLALTLDDPLSRVLPALAGHPESRALVENLGGAARRRLTDIANEDIDWGVRHGDVTMDNVHRTEAGLVIHDFDLAHVGWRVADLSSCLATPFAEAFRAGYTEVRAIGAADNAALPGLRVIESIGNLAFDLTEMAAWRGTESLDEGWLEDGLADLRTLAGHLL